jgi:hypothetical protein
MQRVSSSLSSRRSSRDGERMLRSMRAVYERQWPLVEGNPTAEHAWQRGHRQLTDIFLDCLVENIDDRMRRGNPEGVSRAARVLARESPERWQAVMARLPAETTAHPR